MPVVNVLGDELRWADDVACEKEGGAWAPKVLRLHHIQCANVFFFFSGPFSELLSAVSHALVFVNGISKFYCQSGSFFLGSASF